MGLEIPNTFQNKWGKKYGKLGFSQNYGLIQK